MGPIPFKTFQLSGAIAAPNNKYTPHKIKKGIHNIIFDVSIILHPSLCFISSFFTITNDICFLTA